VDINRETIRVRQQVQRVGGQLRVGLVKTSTGKRDLPVLRLAEKALDSRRVVQALNRKHLRAAWSDTGLVFASRRGLPIEPRNVDRTFARICKDNGLRRIRLRGLRYTTATLLKALGVPPKDAQVILGHAHITTTNQINTHVDEAAKREALSKLNKLLGGG
jgi:integrase